MSTGDISDPLTELIEKAPSSELGGSVMNGTFVKTMLLEYSREKSHLENTKCFKCFNPTVLLNTVRYLNISYNGKCVNINELKTRNKSDRLKYKLSEAITNKLRSFHNNECNLCSKLYIPSEEHLQDKASCCISCGIERHNCASVIPPTYHLWVCKTCTHSISPPLSEFLLEADESANSAVNTLETDTTSVVDNESITFETKDGAADTKNIVSPDCQTYPSDSLDSPPPPESVKKPMATSQIAEAEMVTENHTTSQPLPPCPPPPSPFDSTNHPQTSLHVAASQAQSLSFPPQEHQHRSPSLTPITQPPITPVPTQETQSSNHSSKKPNRRQITRPQQTSRAYPRKICRYLERGVCWFGAWGLDGGRCHNFHPEPCEKFMSNGAVLPYGCNKGANCRYYHLPFFCENSTRYLWCDIKNCKLFHHM